MEPNGGNCSNRQPCLIGSLGLLSLSTKRDLFLYLRLFLVSRTLIRGVSFPFSAFVLPWCHYYYSPCCCVAKNQSDSSLMSASLFGL